jgi:CRISPR-associated protein Csx10
MRIDYEIHFKESWRVGSGEAAGPFLDSVVRRDGHGLPFVPGTTLRGLVADALRVLCASLRVPACDGTVGRDDPSQAPGELCGVTRDGLCPLCALTGSPHRESELRWGAARVRLTAGGRELEDPDARRALAREADGAPGLLTRSHPRTAIDRRSGRAADEKLFSLEEASPRLVLAGRLESADEVASDHLALLVAALRWVRELGGGRRRGLGSCRILPVAVDLTPHFTTWQDALRHLEALRQTAPRATAPARVGAAPAPPPVSALPATVLLLDALVVGEVSVGRRPESGNQIAGLPFVPGSTVRGALAARWRGDPGAEDFQRCFLSGAIRFGFLHPPLPAGADLPVPLSLHTCKLRPGRRAELRHGLIDLLYHPDEERCRECASRLVAWDATQAGELPTLALSPHNRVDPVSQTVGEAGLFAYETLPEGTRLRGLLRAATPGDLERLLAGAGLALGSQFSLRAGRRKGSLGHLDCTLAAVPGGGLAAPLPELAPLPAPWPEGAALRIDLLTPAIVRDARLRFRRHLLPADFGLARAEFDACFAAGSTIAGWNSAHRLPKADALAVAARSSCLLEDPTAEERAALSRAAATGIGERREEGFGAFALRAITAADRDRS